MTDAHIYAGTLLATNDDRTFDALLVPYGEQCSSNLGRFAVDTGAFSLPADPRGSVFNHEHERERVNGEVVSFRETPEGIRGRVYFAKSEQGDAGLDDVLKGRRRAISAEVADVVIRAGKAVSGRVFGAALVREGAFPSATLLAAAVDIGEEPADDVEQDDDAATTTDHVESEYTDELGVTWRRVEDTEVTTEQDKTTTTTTVVEEIDDPSTEQTDQEEDTVPAATAPNTLTARRTKGAAPAQPSFKAVMNALHRMKERRPDAGDSTLLAAAAPRTLFAALEVIPATTEAGDAVAQVQNPFPQWLGQLWNGRAHVRDVIDLLSTGELTADTIAGWKWETEPEGADYDGNGAQPHSNQPKAVPYTEPTYDWAGAHDHPNKLRHFSNPEYWESYYKAMNESYSKWSNDRALSALVGRSTQLVADAVPANLAAGLSYLIDGIVQVIDANALPTFALVDTTLYKGILKTTNNNVLGYLDMALGFEDGTLAGQGFKLRAKSRFVHRDVDTDLPEVRPFQGVIVGAKEATTFYELPGVPFRIEAEDLSKGGLDTGLFGYAGTVTHMAEATVHVGTAAQLAAVHLDED